MQKLYKLAIAIAAIALFATGFQAKSNIYYAHNGKNGEVPVVSG
jgi:hypothetical protein